MFERTKQNTLMYNVEPQAKLTGHSAQSASVTEAHKRSLTTPLTHEL